MENHREILRQELELWLKEEREKELTVTVRKYPDTFSTCDALETLLLLLKERK